MGGGGGELGKKGEKEIPEWLRKELNYPWQETGFNVVCARDVHVVCT